MHLKIISPDKKLYEDEVTTLTLPGIDQVDWYPRQTRSASISALKKGKIKVTDKASARHVFEINGGVVEVLNNKVIVLAE